MSSRPPLSYATTRIYNTSPLVSRNQEYDDGLEAPRNAGDTESTASTTAPSTVWDELDDLKSRMRKLELTGKLPATSGAAVAHASERPPTATTTNTTMSTSPKRGRGFSNSPTDSNNIGQALSEPHPLLHAALVKAEPLLSKDVFKALETTAQDALTIAAMTGSNGDGGLVSGAQSTIGSVSMTLSDRQLRRKADSLCRSLTELCLALTEMRQESESPQAPQTVIRPQTRDRPSTIGLSDLASSRTADGLIRLKSQSSPRAMSRLEARRSSLLAGSAAPSPRYAASEAPTAPTPTQSSLPNRRTSVLLRSRRGATEELEDDEARFRAPSRATTEVLDRSNSTRMRVATREYMSTQPLPAIGPVSRAIPSAQMQSTLPLRRQYNAAALNANANINAQIDRVASSVPSFVAPSTNRRYLERSTPERDLPSLPNGNDADLHRSNTNSSHASVIHKLAEERGLQRSATSIGTSFEGRGLGGGLGRTGSLDKARRLRPRLGDRGESHISEVSGGSGSAATVTGVGYQ